MTHSLRVAASLVVLALAAACGGGDGGQEAERSDAASDAASEAESAAPTVPAAPADPAAAEAEIRATFEKVFDSETSSADALALAQDAAAIAPTLEQAQTASPGGHRTVAVTSVTFTIPTEATVMFDILLEGTTLLPAFQGGAVFEDGIWKVSRKTNCDLAALAGFSCPDLAG